MWTMLIDSSGDDKHIRLQGETAVCGKHLSAHTKQMRNKHLKSTVVAKTKYGQAGGRDIFKYIKGR